MCHSRGVLKETIRFRVTPSVKLRADRVLRVRSAGRVNPETISDLGREAFLAFVEAQEAAHGIKPKSNGKSLIA